MDFPQSLEMTDETLIPLYLAIVVTFTLGIGFIIFCVVYLRRLFSQKLELQRLESEHRKNLLEASLQVQENERIRIAQDLHDDIGALLSTIKLYTSHIEETFHGQGTNELPQKVNSLVDQTVVNLRQISQNLMPSNLIKFGLESAAEEICQQINEANQAVKVHFSSTLTSSLSEDQSLHLYRIIQELLNNALKHARAKKITIQIQNDEQVVQFLYQDDGIGFDINQVEHVGINKNSLGIKTIASRVEMLNAKINYQSAPNQGLSVKITFSI